MNATTIEPELAALIASGLKAAEESVMRAADPAMSVTTRANGIRIAKDVLGSALALLEARLPSTAPSPTASSITP